VKCSGPILTNRVGQIWLNCSPVYEISPSRNLEKIESVCLNMERNHRRVDAAVDSLSLAFFESLFQQNGMVLSSYLGLVIVYTFKQVQS
jgi:hypothetical protein